MWLDRVKGVYGDDLELTWKNFSLEQVNSKEGEDWKVWEQPDIEARRSLMSQVAAEAARKQGPEAHQKFHLALLTARHGGDDRISLNEEGPLIELAEKVGLDGGRLREDMKDPEAAREEGIFGTPTFVFENGGSAYIKTFIPPQEDAVAEFEHFMAIASDRPYIGEIKRPQPPWPKGALG